MTTHTRPEDVPNEVLAESLVELSATYRSAHTREALRESARRLREMAWRPIAALPESYKDFDTGGYFLTVANYADEPPQVQIQDWLFVDQCEYGLYTVWMPLPPAPAEGGR